MSAIYKNGIAYGGAASAANLISATDASGGASNVQAELDNINENITSLNDDLTNWGINQTPGKSILIDMTITGIQVTSTECDFIVTLPFRVYKRSDYSINLTFFSITNIGSGALSNATVTDKRDTTFRIRYTGAPSVPLANATFTITFT